MHLQWGSLTNEMAHLDDGVSIDLSDHSVVRRGKRYPLSHLQYRLLLCMAAQVNQLVKKDTLLQQVWETTLVSPNDVHLCVSRTRKVLEDVPAQPKYLHTIHGQGYILRSYSHMGANRSTERNGFSK